VAAIAGCAVGEEIPAVISIVIASSLNNSWLLLFKATSLLQNPHGLTKAQGNLLDELADRENCASPAPRRATNF
jgi:hypothetical protein